MTLEHLAGIVLQIFHSSVKRERETISITSFISEEHLKGFPKEHQTEIRHVLIEALEWLKNEGLIAPFHDREGRTNDVEVYRKKTLLPKDLLHPVIVDKVWLLFLQGDYDGAVFQAFKTVEVAVRDAGDFAEEVVDVELMEKAFHPENGELSKEIQAEAEKQATLALFSGAIQKTS